MCGLQSVKSFCRIMSLVLGFVKVNQVGVRGNSYEDKFSSFHTSKILGALLEIATELL